MHALLESVPGTVQIPPAIGNLCSCGDLEGECRYLLNSIALRANRLYDLSEATSDGFVAIKTTRIVWYIVRWLGRKLFVINNCIKKLSLIMMRFLQSLSLISTP